MNLFFCISIFDKVELKLERNSTDIVCLFKVSVAILSADLMETALVIKRLNIIKNKK